MKPVLILYATRDGHTRRIAEHIQAKLGSRNLCCVTRDLRSTNGDIDFSSFGATILAGPIHAGRHPSELVKFVRNKRLALQRLPTVLLSVCLAQAGIENPETPAEKRAEATRAVNEMRATFMEQTGFYPTRTKAVAGALPYTKYNFFVRWLMKRIVKKEAGDTDITRDYVYTDWAALDRFVDQFLADCVESRAVRCVDSSETTLSTESTRATRSRPWRFAQ